MNKLLLTGRPTREPEIRYYSGEAENAKAVANFTLAVNRIFKREGEPNADFIPCVAFGKTAKFIEEYIRKGMFILVSGPLRNNDYTNKEGVKVYSFQMTVESVEILEKKAGSTVKPDEDGFLHMDGTEDEMPFA